MVCPKCGTQNQDGNTFCMACGNPLPSFPAQQAPAQQFQPQQQPQFRQAPQQQFQQMPPPQFQQYPQPQYQPPFAQPVMRKPLIDKSIPFRQRLNIIGLLGALIFLLCIFMPAFSESINTTISYSSSTPKTENLYISQTLIDSGSLSTLNNNLGGNIWGDSSVKLFDGSGKYIAMWILDLVFALAAMGVCALGIDIGVIATGVCTFIIGLLTLIFSASDVGAFYRTLENTFNQYSSYYSYKTFSEYLDSMNVFRLSIGIAPILMLASSLIIIGSGVFSLIRKRKSSPKPAVMYAQPGMMR